MGGAGSAHSPPQYPEAPSLSCTLSGSHVPLSCPVSCGTLSLPSALLPSRPARTILSPSAKLQPALPLQRYTKERIQPFALLRSRVNELIQFFLFFFNIGNIGNVFTWCDYIRFGL